MVDEPLHEVAGVRAGNAIDSQGFSMPLAAGTRVGAYEVVGSLGAGGMGEVYRALDPALGRHVALKILPDAFAADPDRLARFEREARTLASLNHLHIAQIYGLEQSGAIRALVLELVDGDDLAERIRRGPIPVNDALTMARQVADALDAAHEAGIVHRDLKPANIKVRRDDVIKVLDFGLAKAFNREPDHDESLTRTASATQPGAILGTAAYMSPEQTRGRPVDKRADIWSFGCVLYEMLSGKPAFAGDTVSDTVVAILEREPDWTALSPRTPPHVRELLRRCLEKDPKLRLRDMGDAALELRSIQPHDPAPTASRTSPVRAATTAAVLTALAVTGVALALWPRAATSPITALVAAPLTSYPGYESHPSLSPDGNQVAFTWSGERPAASDIYVKLVGPGTPLKLTSDPADDTSPAWSPDGRWIAFLRVRDAGPASLMLVPALGGAERQLGEISVAPFIGGPDVGGVLAWSPDSTALVVAGQAAASEPAGLFAWSLASGERRRLTTLPPKHWMELAPALSPDGRRVAFARFVGFGIGDVFVLPLSAALQPAGEPQRLTHENRYMSTPTWLPDGREIVFTSGSLTSGIASLFAIGAAPSGGAVSPRRLSAIGEHAGLSSIARTRDGAIRMVYVQSHFDSGIWELELPAGEPAADTAPHSAPFMLSTRPEYQPHFSSDGTRVAFVSDSSGAAEIWTCDANGANLVQLTSVAWPETAAPRWSPDGSQVVFHARPDGPGDIFTVAASGGAPKRITDDPADDWGATWSADGQWIYFGSNRSGRFEIWKTPAAGGTAAPVTKNGGIGPTASADFVYYARGPELWHVPINGGEERRVLAGLTDWSRFAVTARGIYFTSRGGAPARVSAEHLIQRFDFADGQIRTVARIDKLPFLGMTVSPDGRTLLFSQIDQSGTDLMLVENLR